MSKKKKTGLSKMMEDFFNFLKKLLSSVFNSKTDDIEIMYGKLATGYYKNDAVQEFNDYKSNNAVAYKLINGVQEIIINEKNGKLKRIPTFVSAVEQNQLIAFTVDLISRNTSSMSFEDKFNIARVQLLEEVFNIDLLIASNPKADEQVVRDKYNRLYNNYRFMLGAREFYNTADTAHLAPADINFTGNEKYNNSIAPYKVPSDVDYGLTGLEQTKNNQFIIDNKNGEYSVALLKEETLKQYKQQQSSKF